MVGLVMLLLADFAVFQTGHDLAATCQRDRLACTRYVEGAADMITSFQAMKSIPTNICLDGSASGGQLTDIVRGFLAENPQALDDPAGKLVWAALYGVYPCSQKGQ